MFRKIAVHYLLGLDAIIRLIGITVVFSVLTWLVTRLAAGIGWLMMADTKNSAVHLILFLFLLPLIARAALHVGGTAGLAGQIRGKLFRPIIPTEPPPSRRSPHAGR